MMAEQRDALTELVQQHVGEGKPWTVRAFAARAVDTATGYSPSPSLVGKIIAGQAYKVTPELVSALALGLGLPRDVVAAAAHYQVIGFEASELSAKTPATLLNRLGERPDRTPKSHAVAERWAADESAAG